MRSSATRWRGSSSSRGVPARARLRSPCTGRPTSCTPTASARAPRRARGRAKPPVPALHRSRSCRRWRDRRRAVHRRGAVRHPSLRTEDRATTRLKGDARMVRVLAERSGTVSAAAGRRRVPYDRFVLRLTPAASAEIVASARRRVGPHNVRRRYVEALLLAAPPPRVPGGTGPVGARGHVRRRLAIRFGPGRAGRGSRSGRRDPHP